jgi:hypothetical protein
MLVSGCRSARRPSDRVGWPRHPDRKRSRSSTRAEPSAAPFCLRGCMRLLSRRTVIYCAPWVRATEGGPTRFPMSRCLALVSALGIGAPSTDESITRGSIFRRSAWKHRTGYDICLAIATPEVLPVVLKMARSPAGLRRYSAFGGLSGLIRTLRSGSLSFREVGDQAGVCGETVRQAVIQNLGLSGYRDLIEARRPTRPEARVYTAKEAISVLRDPTDHSEHRPDLAKALVLQLLSDQLTGIEATRSPAGVWRFHCNGTPLYMLCTPAGSLRCYTLYIFKTGQVDAIKSLNLRFANFTRASKWSGSRNLFSLLADKTAPGGSSRPSSGRSKHG